MRILRKKNISEKAPADVKIEPAQAELEPVIDHTTANTIASKEANEKAAEKNIQESGILEAAEEVVKSIQDPAKKTKAPKTPSLKPYTEAKQVVNRKELADLIRECTKANRVFKVKKSLEEGYRYVFEEFVDDYPECYFVCHSDDDANNENGYFDTLDDAKEYALEHPEICCIFRVCGDEEESVWNRSEIEENLEEANDNKAPELPDAEKEPLEEKTDITVLANNRAQVMANDNNKPVIYGFTKNGKFTEVAPIVCDDLEKETNNVKIQNADLTVYVAYPGKDIVEGKEVEKPIADEEENECLNIKENSDTDEELTDEEKNDELKEAIVAPENDGFGVDDNNEEATTASEVEETSVEEPKEPVEVEEPVEVKPEEEPTKVAAEEKELAVEQNPDEEIEIDSIETYEPTDEVCKKTFTTIKDAGDSAMFAFKDTLKDLYNLKIKVSDLQQLLSSSSDWLLDILGFNENHEEQIHPEELPETPTEVEEPEVVGGEFDEVEPITDVSSIDMNAFDEVEPIEFEEEDEKFFVGD